MYILIYKQVNRSYASIIQDCVLILLSLHNIHIIELRDICYVHCRIMLYQAKYRRCRLIKCGYQERTSLLERTPKLHLNSGYDAALPWCVSGTANSPIKFYKREDRRSTQKKRLSVSLRPFRWICQAKPCTV